MINQKIEKVKELLMSDELLLSKIALQLGYRSTARLSTQFKKLTGFTVHNSNKWEDKAGNH